MIDVYPLKPCLWKLFNLCLELRYVEVILWFLVKLKNKDIFDKLLEGFGANLEKLFHVFNLETLLHHVFEFILSALELLVEIRPW